MPQDIGFDEKLLDLIEVTAAQAPVQVAANLYLKGQLQLRLLKADRYTRPQQDGRHARSIDLHCVLYV